MSAVCASLLVTACGGRDTDNEAPFLFPVGDATLTSDELDASLTAAAGWLTAIAATRTAAPAATEPGAASTRISGGEVEVQGIVGAVDEDGRTIEINPLQGAVVEVIEVDAGTRITSARGPTLRLGDLRPSDRIIARGTLAGGVLVATEIEVGQAVPGAVPGG